MGAQKKSIRANAQMAKENEQLKKTIDELRSANIMLVRQRNALFGLQSEAAAIMREAARDLGTYSNFCHNPGNPHGLVLRMSAMANRLEHPSQENRR